MSEEESKSEFEGPIAGDGRMSNRWFFSILLVVALILYVLARPVLIGHPPRPSYSEIYAMRDIKYALYSFADDHSSFPNDETAIKIAEEYPDVDGLLNPKYAEDYFRQLVVLGYLDESVLEGIKRKEMQLTYVVWQEKMPSESAAPLLLAPMVKGKRKFDRVYAKEEMKKYALQLRVDMSISDIRIDKNGRAKIGGKTDFFDADKLPWWNEQEWKLAWPE